MLSQLTVNILQATSAQVSVHSRDGQDLIKKNDIVLLIPVDEAYRASLNYK